MRHLRVFIAIVTFFVGLAIPFSSQATVTMSEDVFTVQPAAPGPQEPVQITFNDSNTLPPGSTLRWFIDGVEQTDRWRVGETFTVNSENSPHVRLVTKEAGQMTEVKALLTTRGVSREYLLYIEPTRLDLIINSNSHTPSFYRGRSLPSRGSTITAQALVFTDEPGPLTYRWSINNKNVHQSVGNNNSSIQYELGLNYEIFVEVRVFNARGDLVAAENVKFIPTDPEILFYEANPLRGLVPNVLRDPYQFLNHEVTLRGEPYFFAGDANDMKITWKVDRKNFVGDTNPFELSLIKNKESGSADVYLKIINTDNHLTSAEATLNMRY